MLLNDMFNGWNGSIILWWIILFLFLVVLFLILVWFFEECLFLLSVVGVFLVLIIVVEIDFKFIDFLDWDCDWDVDFGRFIFVVVVFFLVSFCLDIMVCFFLIVVWCVV